MEDLKKPSSSFINNPSDKPLLTPTINHKPSSKQQVDNKNKLQQLSPFFDNGIVRERGRLRNSNLPDATKHPIILNPKDPIVRMMIDSAHCRCMLYGTEYVRNKNLSSLGTKKFQTDKK